MASKKKRNPPRSSSASRGGTRPAGTRPAGAKAGSPTAKPAAPRPASGPKGPTRSERLAAAEKARRSKAMRTRALITAAMVGVLTLITVTVISSRRSNDRVVTKLEASGSCSYDTKTDSDGGLGNNHVQGVVRYDTDPPAGGNHNSEVASAGVYTVENKPPDAHLVHSLEHGYVDIWYRPDIPTATLDELKALAGRDDRDVLLVPRESLTQPVAATAWHRRLLCTQPDLKALDQFVSAYRNKGPEKIPH